MVERRADDRTVTKWTGAKVFALRDAAWRQSQRDFAQEVGINESTVYKWERYDRILSPEYAKMMDTSYGRLDNVQKARFWDALTDPSESGDQPEVVGTDWDEWLEMNRRQVGALMGMLTMRLPGITALLAPMQPSARERITRIAVGADSVDEAAIADVETALSVALNQNDRFGPHAALSTVTAQRGIVDGMLAVAPDGLKTRLHALHSHLSQVAGWMSFDLNRFDEAQRYYEEARGSAHRAHNTDLVILVLCNLSYLETWRGNPGPGIDHAMAARHWARNAEDMMLLSYAESRTALAMAAADDNRAECLTALDAASAALERVDAQDARRSIAYFAGAGLLEWSKATCLTKMGRVAEAERHAMDSLRLYDPAHVRNTALTHVALANIHIEHGDVERAAASVTDGARLAATCASDRLTRAIKDTRRGLDRWHTAKPVRELDAELAVYLKPRM